MRTALFQDLAQVAYVVDGQPQRLDFGQFGIGRNVRNSISKQRKGRVDGHRSLALLFIARISLLAQLQLQAAGRGVGR